MKLLTHLGDVGSALCLIIVGYSMISIKGALDAEFSDPTRSWSRFDPKIQWFRPDPRSPSGGSVITRLLYHLTYLVKCEYFPRMELLETNYSEL